METPISSRRITRSQTKAAAAITSSDAVKGLMESRQRAVNQSALFDITNDSPVFGLAIGEISKRRSGYQYNNREIATPGSGEALLRNQVKKILLQKVEEESELSKISMNEIVMAMEKGGGGDDGFGSKKELMITRSLLPEFLDESAEDKEGVVVENNQEEEEEEEKEEKDDSVMVDELCEYFVKKMNVGGGERARKHTRFVYNSDDEIQVEEEEEEECVLRLKGLPTPKGKHVRFPEEE